MGLFLRFLSRKSCRLRSFAEPQDIVRRCLTMGLFLRFRHSGFVALSLQDLRTLLRHGLQVDYTPPRVILLTDALVALPRVKPSDYIGALQLGASSQGDFCLGTSWTSPKVQASGARSDL